MNASSLKTLCCLALAICTAMGMADPSQAQGPHSHQPLVVRSKPVIERLPVKVVAPVDVASSKDGQTLIADAVGQSIFRIYKDGNVDLVASELAGLSSIVEDSTGNVVALLNARGSARIVQVTAQGFVSEAGHVPFEAHGLAVDLIGNTYTANGRTGEVVVLNNDGTRQTLAKVSGPVSDLVLDSAGNVIVLLNSGKVVSVAVDGSTRTVGFTSRKASRLTLHPDGQSSLWKIPANHMVAIC